MSDAQLRRHRRRPQAHEQHLPAWWRTASPPGSSPRTTPCGVPTPRRSPLSGSAGSRRPPSRGRWWPTSWNCRDALRAEGVDRIVLCGMGGSSLAPEVIARHRWRRADRAGQHRPGQVRAALADRLDRTALWFQSKSGSTVETDSPAPRLRAGLHRAPASTRRAGSSSSPTGSPLDKASSEAGYRAVFNADPNVGGRYSALTASAWSPRAWPAWTSRHSWTRPRRPPRS